MPKKLECNRKGVDPTVEQIEDRAAEIRSRWSVNVTAQRKVRVDPPWTPPLVTTIELIRELNASSN